MHSCPLFQGPRPLFLPPRPSVGRLESETTNTWCGGREERRWQIDPPSPLPPFSHLCVCARVWVCGEHKYSVRPPSVGQSIVRVIQAISPPSYSSSSSWQLFSLLREGTNPPPSSLLSSSSSSSSSSFCSWRLSTRFRLLFSFSPFVLRTVLDAVLLSLPKCDT